MFGSRSYRFLLVMANSDNVVRLGLTPKPKDKETLLEVYI